MPSEPSESCSLCKNMMAQSHTVLHVAHISVTQCRALQSRPELFLLANSFTLDGNYENSFDESSCAIVGSQSSIVVERASRKDRLPRLEPRLES